MTILSLSSSPSILHPSAVSSCSRSFIAAWQRRELSSSYTDFYSEAGLSAPVDGCRPVRLALPVPASAGYVILDQPRTLPQGLSLPTETQASYLFTF